MRTVIKYLAVALSAALCWAAFPPCCEVAGIVVALVPMLIIARTCHWRECLKWFFYFGFAYWFATLAWMPAIVKNNGPLVLVVLGWAGLSAYCAIFFALFGAFTSRMWSKVGEKRVCSLLALTFGEALLWMFFEWLRAMVFGGFAWNFLGVSLATIPYLASPACVGGVYLVSGLIVVVNGVFATILLRTLRPHSLPRWERICETALPLAMVLIVMFIARKIQHATLVAPDAEMRVALAQRNAPCIFKSGERTNPITVYDELLAAAKLARPDLIVWGESAMTEFNAMLKSVTAIEVAHQFMSNTGGALIVGGDDIEKVGNERRFYNSAALYSLATNEVQVYHKQHLVPFGEFIPMDKTFPALQKLSPIGVSCWPGKPQLLKLPLKKQNCELRMAPLICFEDTDSSLARQAATDGANVLVGLTNDNWFSFSCEALQHIHQAIMRAIETGLPLIRTANGGVTGIILPNGSHNFLSDGDGKVLTDQAGCQLGTLAFAKVPRLTPYTRCGDWPLVVLGVILLSVLFIPTRHS